MNSFFSKYEEFDTKSIIFNDSVNNGYDIISQKDLQLSSIINNDIQFEALNIGEILKSKDFSSNKDILNNLLISEISNNPSNNLIIEINEKNHEQNYNISIEHLSQKNIESREIRFKTKSINTGSINTKKKKYPQENNQKSFIKKGIPQKMMIIF